MHECLDEVPPGAFLGLVDAVLAQHLRADDRRGLLGDHHVPGQVVRTRLVAGHQHEDPALEGFAQSDRRGHHRPRPGRRVDRLDPGVVVCRAARRRGQIGGQHAEDRLADGFGDVRRDAVVRDQVPARVERQRRIARQIRHLADQQLQARSAVEQSGQRRVHMRGVAHDVHLAAQRTLGQQAVQCGETRREGHLDDDEVPRQPPAGEVDRCRTVDDEGGRTARGQGGQRAAVAQQCFGPAVDRDAVERVGAGENFGKR